MNRTFGLHKLEKIKGFLLIDVLFAMVIISVSLIPIATMFGQSIQANVIAKDYTLAANLLQKQLELLKTWSPETWANLTLPCTLPWSDTIQLPPPRYILTTKVNRSAANDHLVEVTVVASWQERSREYKLEFITLYSTL